MRRNAHHFADLDELGNVKTPLPLFVLRYEGLRAVDLLGNVTLSHASLQTRVFEPSQKAVVEG